MAAERGEAEEDGLDEIDFWAGVGFNVYGACPADLLEHPAAEANGSFRLGDSVGDEADAVALEEEASSEMSIFVDNLVQVSFAVYNEHERIIIPSSVRGKSACTIG